MESLERSKAVIELGKRLIAQMELGDDELAQWMAHVLAERINNVQNAPPQGRIAAQNACAELIFQLWERRHSFPAQFRPFKKLEPLLRTLNSLDESNGPRFLHMKASTQDVEIEEDVERILSFAVKLDDAARILVRHFLAMAAAQASEESKPWIQSATDAEADVALEVRIVNFVDHDLDCTSDGTKIARKALIDKVRKLEVFASLATSYAIELREKHSLGDDPQHDESSD